MTRALQVHHFHQDVVRPRIEIDLESQRAFPRLLLEPAFTGQSAVHPDLENIVGPQCQFHPTGLR